MSHTRTGLFIAVLVIACLVVQLWRVNSAWQALYNEDCLVSRPAASAAPDIRLADVEKSLAVLRALERNLMAKQAFLSAQQASVEKARYELGKARGATAAASKA